VKQRSTARAVILHLRLPFFFFLSPIYLFAMVAIHAEALRAVAVFFIFHFLLYPASNGFNSYYDKDEGPIGGLASPPPVTKALLATALVLDALALAGAFLLGPVAGFAVLAYGSFSKLYSWDKTRLKARPWVSWLMVGVGQGSLSFLAIAAASGRAGLSGLGDAVLLCALLQGFFLMGVFPLTQVYQHEEDARRGDLTISRVLGIRGTFVLAGVFLGLAATGLTLWIAVFASPLWSLAFLASQLPALVYFLFWARRCFKDPASANFRSTMVMNVLASGCLNAFLLVLIILR
jgi:1,4-dihydroxy-2-naphthoate octaprenyltransferase